MHALVLAAASHGTGAVIIGLIVLVLIVIGIGAVLYTWSVAVQKKVVDNATHHDQHPSRP